MIVALVLPVRTALAHAEVDRLEHEWADLVALDLNRATLVSRLMSESVSTDAVTLRQATIALDDEEVRRVSALRHSLPANHLDHGASALRGAIAQAFDREVAGLRASIAGLRQGGTILPSQLEAATIDVADVQSMIDQQRHRFGEDLHDQHPSAATLHAADATLADFAHFASAPLGVRLLVTTGFGIRVLDIDHSTDTAVDLGADTHTVVAAGSLYAVSGDRVFRLPADLSGGGQDLGPGESLFPGPGGDLWVTTADDTLRLITAAGRTMWGPQPVAYEPIGSVDEGVLVADLETHGFAVIDPQTATVVRLIETPPGATPLLLGAARDTVAYAASKGDLDIHVVTASTGASRDVAILSAGSQQSGTGVLSPDGKWLSTYEISASGGATPLVVNLRSGAVTQLSNVSNPDPDLSMAWTADSSRVFFTVNEDGATVATWHIGDPLATVLRWRGATASSVLVLP